MREFCYLYKYHTYDQKWRTSRYSENVFLFELMLINRGEINTYYCWNIFLTISIRMIHHNVVIRTCYMHCFSRSTDGTYFASEYLENLWRQRDLQRQWALHTVSQYSLFYTISCYKLIDMLHFFTQKSCTNSYFFHCYEYGSCLLLCY